MAVAVVLLVDDAVLVAIAVVVDVALAEDDAVEDAVSVEMSDIFGVGVTTIDKVD